MSAPVSGKYLFRCDGNAATGLGHVSRGIALAEALEEIGAECCFAGNYGDGAISLLRSAGFSFLAVPPMARDADASETIGLMEEAGAHAVVFDSYAINPEHMADVQRRTSSSVVIDDFAIAPELPCAALINFTVGAPQLPYAGPASQYLLGPRYLLVRRRLRQVRRRGPRPARAIQRLLLVIGGTDRHQLIRRTVAALTAVAPLVTVRLAAAPAEMSALLTGFGPGSGVVPMGADLADEFATSDACISGGGLTKYESAYLGVPVAVVSQTPEQATETESFARHGLAFDLGPAPSLSETEFADSLAAFFQDTAGRQSQVDAGFTVFPEDPTRNAAEALATRLIHQVSA